jgi:hypothetical protein
LRCAVSILAAVLLLAACASPSAMTAKATHCGRTEVQILDSQYKREGVTTAWCARCKDKNYQCVTSPARDRVECREARPGTPCG